MTRFPTKIATFLPSDELFFNPHKGFMSFQRYRGDELNEETLGEKWRPEIGWKMEELSDEVGFCGYCTDVHPDTSIAYFRIPWSRLEPCKDLYRLDVIEDVLRRAAERGQTVAFRFPPHGARPSLDLPEWMREELGLPPREEKDKASPICDFFFERYEKLIRIIGERINGDRRVSFVDISIVSAWGEGAQMDMLPEHYRNRMVDAYVEAFSEIPLVAQFNCVDTVKYANRKRPVGVRADCLGAFKEGWRHMRYSYPRAMAQLADVWKSAPILFESCWVMRYWLECGWDIDFIIEESLRWHISAFNEKSVAIPPELSGKVNEWIKRMGYRFALRIFEYPERAAAGDALSFNLAVDNRGVAPIYHRYPLLIKLKGAGACYEFDTKIDITKWMPGGSFEEITLTLMPNIPSGEYEILLGITDGTDTVHIASDAPRDGSFIRVGRLKITDV